MKDLDSMFRAAMAQLAPKPDPKKGRTCAEIAKDEGVSLLTVQRKMPLLVEAGIATQDEDYRADRGGRMRRHAVYRFVKGKR